MLLGTSSGLCSSQGKSLSSHMNMTTGKPPTLCVFHWALSQIWFPGGLEHTHQLVMLLLAIAPLIHDSIASERQWACSQCTYITEAVHD